MDKKRHDIFPLKDPVKKSLFVPKILLETTNLWPEKRSKITKIICWICIIFCIFIESGQVAFVVANIKDITKIASAMSTVSTTFQIITKSLALYFYGGKLKAILTIIWNDFWPAKLGGSKIERELKIYNDIIIRTSLMMLGSAIPFAFGFLSAPLINGIKILPFEAIYPFDWSKTPIYEIIYVLEWLVNISFIILGICGHDFLFVGICSTEDVTSVNEEFDGFKPVLNQQNEDGKLLKRCIEHHILLKHVCKEVAEIFSFTAFIQLFSSVTALCVAALIMTLAEVDVALLLVISAYLFGHLVQLALFCALGNELTDHVMKFPVFIFRSRWYDIEINLKKDLVFVMHMAQQEVRIFALGMKALNFETFIGVLKLSFSFYTMLTKVTEYNNM